MTNNTKNLPCTVTLSSSYEMYCQHEQAGDDDFDDDEEYIRSKAPELSKGSFLSARPPVLGLTLFDVVSKALGGKNHHIVSKTNGRVSVGKFAKSGGAEQKRPGPSLSKNSPSKPPTPNGKACSPQNSTQVSESQPISPRKPSPQKQQQQQQAEASPPKDTTLPVVSPTKQLLPAAEETTLVDSDDEETEGVLLKGSNLLFLLLPSSFLCLFFIIEHLLLT